MEIDIVRFASADLTLPFIFLAGIFLAGYFIFRRGEIFRKISRIGPTPALGAQAVIGFLAFSAYREYPSPWFIGLGAAASAVLMMIVFKIRSFLEAIPTSKVRSVAMGMAELSGKTMGQKKLKGPFSGRECFAYEIEEKHLRGHGKHRHWVTVRQERKDGHFYIDDGTGQMLCDTKGATFEVKPFVRHLGRIQKREAAILPGQKIFAIGKVVDNPFVKEASSLQGWKDMMMSEGEIYLLSDKSEKSLRKWYTLALGFSALATMALTAGAILLAGI